MLAYNGFIIAALMNSFRISQILLLKMHIQVDSIYIQKLFGALNNSWEYNGALRPKV